MISKGKCISYLVALLEACRAATVYTKEDMKYREQLYLYTIGLLFVLQTHVI